MGCPYRFVFKLGRLRCRRAEHRPASSAAATALRRAPGRRMRCCPWTSPRPRSSRRPACAGSTSSRRGRADRDWLEEHFDFHPLDYEDVYSRNQRPKLDQYDDYVFIVLHFPMFEKDDRADPDRRARPVHGAGLPDHAAEHPAAAADRDVRALPREGRPARGRLLEGLGLPALQDRRHRRRRRRSRCCARWASSSSGSRTTSSRGARRRSSATSPRRSRRSSTSAGSSRPQRAVLRDLERTKQRYLQEELEIYFDDISDAAERIWDTLENYKEVIEALESTERVRPVAPPERLVPDPDRGERRAPAADPHREHLRDERAVPGRGRAVAFWRSSR